MDLKYKLREIALENGANFFGVANVERWKNAPIGHRPTDIFPNAKSVIVLGIKVPQGAIESNLRSYEGRRHGIFTYMTFGYNRLGEILDRAGMRLLKYLEDEHNVGTFPIPGTLPRDEHKMMGLMSNRHAAVCAGLAEFGWLGLVMTPETGPRVRWMPLIIDEELEPDSLYSGPKLCKGASCRKCVEICPVNALSDRESVLLRIEDKVYSYSVLRKPRCRCAQTGLARGSAGRLLDDIPESMNTVEDWLKMLRRDNIWNKMERVAAQCGRCFNVCPAGKDVR